jgi:hypothetical protein
LRASEQDRSLVFREHSNDFAYNPVSGNGTEGTGIKAVVAVVAHREIFTGTKPNRRGSSVLAFPGHQILTHFNRFLWQPRHPLDAEADACREVRLHYISALR